MGDARLIRRIRFHAAHHYGAGGSSDAEDRDRAGDPSESHEHEWTLEVHVVGPVDPDTGWLTDLGELDGAVDDLVGEWEGSDLNAAVPAVADGSIQPSTEALATWIYQTLEPRVAGPARLACVRLFESPDLGAQYPA